MQVVVHLHSILQRKTPDGLLRRLDVEMPEASTIQTLVEHLQIEIDPGHLLFALNGRFANPDQVMADGDEVHVMVPISGG
jgi:sulfur carrier protein ThiS